MLFQRSSAKTMSIYRFARTNLSFVYMAPFDGALAHPGQFHVILPGCLPKAVARVSGGLRGRWMTEEDQVVEQQLETNAALMAAVKKLSWRKGVGAVIDLKWTLQVRAKANGQSHLVMQAGTYSGLLMQKAGIEAFLRVVDGLSPLLVSAAVPAQHFAFECHDEMAEALLGPQSSTVRAA